jgi:hypothetical protein
MTGHIRRRGERSWELKFDLGTDPLTGRRLTRYHSFKGTKREAEAELTRLKAAANRGDYVDPSKTTLSEFLDRWEAWAATQVSAKTLERYSELLRHHVRPQIGAARIQKLRTVDFAELYGKLQEAKPEGAGLAPRTIGHVHRLLHRVFGHALKWAIVINNPVAAAEPPRVQSAEIRILDPGEIRTALDVLRAPPHGLDRTQSRNLTRSIPLRLSALQPACGAARSPRCGGVISTSMAARSVSSVR